jgi:heme-degrading monooxygenase HmoA
MAVKRVWHGWTTPGNAEAYWTVLSESVIPGIEKMSIQGYRGIEVLRREHDSEVEFVTMMTFDSIQSVINFQGEDYARCYVPDVAQAVLSRWDLQAAHYEVLDDWANPEGEEGLER